MKQAIKFYVRGTSKGVEQQLELLNKYYDNMENSILISIYEDINENTNNIHGIKKLLNEVQPGDIILITTLDRLARNIKEHLKLEKKIEELGATIKYVCEERKNK